MLTGCVATTILALLALQVFLPDLLGRSLTKLFTYLVGVRFDVGSAMLGVRLSLYDTSLSASVAKRTATKDGGGRKAPFRPRLFVSVEVADAGFGNPPNFPMRYFASAKRISLQLSADLETLGKLGRLRRVWGRSPQRCAAPVDDPATGTRRNVVMLGCVRVHCLEVEGARLRFDQHNGLLNVNGVVRAVAEAEAARSPRGKRSLPPDPLGRRRWPNRLDVTVFSARNLCRERPGRGRAATADTDFEPVIAVTVRGACRRTPVGAAGRGNLHPVFEHDPLCSPAGTGIALPPLPLDDASAVIHVTTTHESRPCGASLSAAAEAAVPAGATEGQWLMTAKWLVINPQHCWHEPGTLASSSSSSSSFSGRGGAAGSGGDGDAEGGAWFELEGWFLLQVARERARARASAALVQRGGLRASLSQS